MVIIVRSLLYTCLTSYEIYYRRFTFFCFIIFRRLRRHTDTGLGSLSLSSLGLDPYGRHSSYGSGGRSANVRPGASRSWHPSPYVSEDEDEREEKKAKIKAEIARRRQHLEESARLHDPMYKMSAGE